MNKTSYNGLSDLMRECKKSVAASLFTEIVILHFSSSVGWNLMLGAVAGQVMQILPFFLLHNAEREKLHILQ
jgi:uncharacterized membrane protein YjjP (DUF1212 family)